MQLHTGTSGYSYKEWKGSFYPDDLPAARMLPHYAERLGTVEINNTFYRMPKASVVAGWAEQVPADFRFVLKASMRLTHKKRLKECAEDVAYMLAQFEPMGARLGAVLFQLPPNFKQDLERLAAFLELLPRELPTAFEFRHPSWFDESTYERLRAHGCALVASEDDDAEPPPVVATAPLGYLRLRREAYTEPELDAWVARVRAQPWERVFCFFKHEDAGAGPRLAADFQARFDRAG